MVLHVRYVLGTLHGRGLPNCNVTFQNLRFEREREQTSSIGKTLISFNF